MHALSECARMAAVHGHCGATVQCCPGCGARRRTITLVACATARVGARESTGERCARRGPEALSMLLAETEAQEAAGVRKKAEGNGGAPAEKVGRAVAEGECVREADVETLQNQKRSHE